MNFLKKVRASVYGPEYYASLRDKSLSYSIGYFMALTAWLAVIVGAVLLLSFIPTINLFLSSATQKVVAYYPENLTITVASGSVSANVPQPYFIPLPDELKTHIAASPSYSMSSSSPVNLLTIDTKHPITVQEFQDDQTVILLASDSLAYVKDQSMVVVPLDTHVSGTITKATVTSLVQKIEPYFKFIDLVVGIFVPIGVFLVTMLRLVYLFFLALLIWGLAHIRKVPGGYGQAYRWGLHLMTLPLIVSALLGAILPGANVPFLFTVLAVVMAWINLGNAPEPVPPMSAPAV